MTPEQLELHLMEQSRTLGRIEEIGRSSLKKQDQIEMKVDSMHDWMSDLDHRFYAHVGDEDKHALRHKQSWNWRVFWRDWNTVIAIGAFLGLGGVVWVYDLIVTTLHKLPIMPMPK